MCEVGERQTESNCIKYIAVIPRRAWDIYQEVRPNDAIYDLLAEFLAQWRIPANSIPALPNPLAGVEVSIDKIGVKLTGTLLLTPDFQSDLLDVSDNLLLVPRADWVPVSSVKAQPE